MTVALYLLLPDSSRRSIAKTEAFLSLHNHADGDKSAAHGQSFVEDYAGQAVARPTARHLFLFPNNV
jgi:hypothetical protein